MFLLLQLALGMAVVATSAYAQTISLEDGAIRAAGVAENASIQVYVEGLPAATALLGASTYQDGNLRFAPRYPLEPGIRYRVELSAPNRTSVVEVVEIPAAPPGEPARVEAIYPSSDELPENLLRLYVHFSAPMSRGDAYSRLSLIEERSGRPVELPFLELEQELWDPAGRRLTVLLDPGRIKRGLVPNVEEGLPLSAGRSYRLVVSRDWPDAGGRPLAGKFEKRFSVAPADYESPSTPRWVIDPPAQGTRDPVSVRFGASVDRALALRLIDVLAWGRRVVSGEASLQDAETRWSFRPEQPWAAGRYRLRIDGALEDPSGNSIVRPFEVLPGEPGNSFVPQISYLSFEIR